MSWQSKDRDRDLVYRKIRELAGQVPAGGVILETGTHVGNMARHLNAAAPHASLYTIDWYQPSVWDEGEIPSLEANQRRFSHLPAVTCIKGKSPDDFDHWQTPIDLLHIDSNYEDEITYRTNLEFWIKHLSDKGTVFGMVFWPGHFHANIITDVCFSHRMMLHAMEGMWWAQQGSLDSQKEA